MDGCWRFVRGTLVDDSRRSVVQAPCVICYVVDGCIVAAIDERLKTWPMWEAVADWGDGLHVPVCSSWRTAPFGMLMAPL